VPGVHVPLAGAGVRLWDVGDMEGWGGESGSCVWVSQAILGTVPDAEPVFKEVGLVQSGPNRTRRGRSRPAGMRPIGRVRARPRLDTDT
jgi:hypothetical protein